MRLFVAVPVPPAADAALEDALAPWRGAVDGARWIGPPNRHITLKFLGEVPRERLEEVSDALGGAAAAASPFALALDAMGAFPRPERATVLWVGLEDPTGELGRLASAIDQALEPIVAADVRPFAAHLTLARFDPPRRLPDGLLDTPIPPSGWMADRVVLFRSRLGGGPPRYEELVSVPL